MTPHCMWLTAWSGHFVRTDICLTTQFLYFMQISNTLTLFYSESVQYGLDVGGQSLVEPKYNTETQTTKAATVTYCGQY